MKEQLDNLTASKSVEIIAHAGNIRACVFGTLGRIGLSGKYVVRSDDGINSVIFTSDDVSKITTMNSGYHSIIYVA